MVVHMVVMVVKMVLIHLPGLMYSLMKIRMNILEDGVKLVLEENMEEVEDLEETAELDNILLKDIQKLG